LLSSFVTLLLGISQVLDLSKACARNSAMEVAQGVRTAELESDNAMLWSKLEQARQALAEADSAWNMLSANQEKLEHECAELRAAVNALKEEENPGLERSRGCYYS
jgi:phosphodiesterase/alkaline phosphatase D-like protein